MWEMIERMASELVDLHRHICSLFVPFLFWFKDKNGYVGSSKV